MLATKYPTYDKVNLLFLEILHRIEISIVVN